MPSASKIISRSSPTSDTADPFVAVTERDYLGSVDPGCATFRQKRRGGDKCHGSAAELDAPVGGPVQGGGGSRWFDDVIQELGQWDPLHAQTVARDSAGRAVRNADNASNTPSTCLSARLTHVQVCATPIPLAYPAVSERTDEAAVVASHDEVVNLSSLFGATAGRPKW